MIEAKTPREFFDKVLPLRFSSDKAAGVDVIVQVDIAGPNGGGWTVTIKDQKLDVHEGTSVSPTLAVKIAESDYMDVVNGRMSGAKAFLTGKLQLKGDIGLALKLRDIGFL